MSVTGDSDNVVHATITTLRDEGFGVRCDSNTQAILTEKLGDESRQERTLGAGNPPAGTPASRTISVRTIVAGRSGTS